MTQGLTNDLDRVTKLMTEDVSSDQIQDRGIQGTLIDDYIWHWTMKTGSILLILLCLAFVSLMLENFTKPYYQIIRAWVPTVAWFITMLCLKKPLELGWIGWIGTTAIAATFAPHWYWISTLLVGNR